MMTNQARKPASREPRYTNTHLFSFLLFYRSLPILVPAIFRVILPPVLSVVPFLPASLTHQLIPEWNVQTFFQPDEFWQALEPAHHLVFESGHLTWEWKDLPTEVTGYKGVGELTIQGGLDEIMAGEPDMSNWKRWILSTESTLLRWTSRLESVNRTPSPEGTLDSGSGAGKETSSGGGRLRGWLWPAVFAGIYWVLQSLCLDGTILIIIAPRVVGLLIAAGTDYYTYQLAYRLLGESGSNAAVFLSMTNLFHAHALPRSLSTSPETFLAVFTLAYWPFPSASDARVTGTEPDLETKRKGVVAEPSAGRDGQDAMEPNLALALLAAAIGFVLRPTNGVFWVVIGGELVWRRVNKQGLSAGMKVLGLAVLIGGTTIVASTALDFFITGKIFLPILSFLSQNIVRDISSFYGRCAWHYHVTQSFPILLGLSGVWAVPGFWRAICGGRVRTFGETARCDTALRILAVATAATIVAFSLIPHKEWRFLHPLLPILLIFASSRLTRDFETPEGGLIASGSVSLSTWLRIPDRSWRWVWKGTVLTTVMWVYLTAFHGRAQVACMERIRQDGIHAREGGKQLRLLALMPCHSTPWISHAHLLDDSGRTGGDGMEGSHRFLTCEPPLSGQANHATQVDRFHADPATYFLESLDSAPPPTHILLFGDLLGHPVSTADAGAVFSDVLEKAGYEESQRWWNGFDILQDEERRRGGVRLWTLL